MTQLPATTETQLPASATPGQVAASLTRFIKASKSEATRHSYTAHAKLFQRYLSAYGIEHPAEIAHADIVPHVCQFAAWLYETPAQQKGQNPKPRKLKSIQASVYGVISMLRREGFDIPRGQEQITEVLKGIGRVVESSVPERMATPKDAARVGMVQDFLSEIRTQEANERVILQAEFSGDAEKLATIERRLNRYKRDAALLSWFFMGAFRRSELGHQDDGEKIRGLDVQHISRNASGYWVRLPIMKQGKAGEKFIPPTDSRNCPVKLMDSWLAALQPGSAGPVFPSLSKWGTPKSGLTGHGVNHIVKHWLRETLQRDYSGEALEAEIKKYASHSFRRGFVTEATAQGFTLPQIVGRTLQSEATAAGYIDPIKQEEEAKKMTLNL